MEYQLLRSNPEKYNVGKMLRSDYSYNTKWKWSWQIHM